MTQTFILANGIGTKLPQAGINEKTLAEAKRFFGVGTAEIMLVNDRAVPGNAFWFLASQQVEALALIVNENLSQNIGAVCPARAIKENIKARRETNQANSNAYDLKKAGPEARRVRHAKFGEGTVVATTETAVTVLFDSQKKPLRLVPAAVQSI